MATTPKPLYSGQPGTGDTLLYTAPAATTTIVKQVTVCNTTGSAATITLGLRSGATLAAANEVFAAKSVAANDTLVIPLTHVLLTTETIRALQGTSTALTVHISGVELT